MVKLSKLKNGLAHIPPGHGMAPGWGITHKNTSIAIAWGVF